MKAIKGNKLLMSRNATKWLLGMLSLLLMFASSTMSSAAASIESQAKLQHYVALGDSITVGYEPGVTLNKATYGYVERLHEQLLYSQATEAHNYGVLGLTSAGLLTLLKDVLAGKTPDFTLAEQGMTGTPQYDAVIQAHTDQVLKNIKQFKEDLQQADVITITIGGNDFKTLQDVLIKQTAEKAAEEAERKIAAYFQNLTESIQLIHSLNADATILIADQYNPFGAPTPYEGTVELHRNLYKKSLAAYQVLEGLRTQVGIKLQEWAAQQVASGVNVTAVQVGASFVGFEAELTHMVKNKDIHPTQAGYEMIAKGFAEGLGLTYSSVQASDPIALVVGGKQLSNQVKPLVVNGSTYIPLRVSEVLGAKVSWNQKAQTAVVLYQNTKLELTIGKDHMLVNGKAVKISSKAFVRSGTTYVPLRLVAEGLGFHVTYFLGSKTAFIQSL